MANSYDRGHLVTSADTNVGGDCLVRRWRRIWKPFCLCTNRYGCDTQAFPYTWRKVAAAMLRTRE